MLTLITEGGRDDTSKSIIVTLSNLSGGNCSPAPPPPPPLGMALSFLYDNLREGGKCAFFQGWKGAENILLGSSVQHLKKCFKNSWQKGVIVSPVM